MANELMTVNYETALGNVQLDPQTVKDYLVRGNGAVSDQEVFLFVKMCQAQRLNPFVAGEAYLIKFGQQPAQMVIGYETYKRRAEENPAHIFTESGIVVVRGQSGEIVQKAGACLYPTETLVGGWCKVHRLKGDREVVTYKEVGISEYNKENTIWKEKPCTMIEKVAISQCLREAYPKDYEGLYTAEELAPTQYTVVVDGNGEVIKSDAPVAAIESGDNDTEENPDDPFITQADRKKLFAKVQSAFGKERGNEILKQCLADEGAESTQKMAKSCYDRINKKVEELVIAEAARQAEVAESDTAQDAE